MYNLDVHSYSLLAVQFAQVFLLLISQPFCSRKKNAKIATVFLTFLDVRKTHTKMTTVSSFSRQNDADSCALNVVRGENLVLVVVLILGSKAL